MKVHVFYTVVLVLLLCGAACEEKQETIPLMEIDFTVQNVSVYNGFDGAITTTHTGGVQPYAYFWSNGQTTKDISGLKAGRYELTIVFGERGVVSKGVEITQPNAALDLAFEVIPESYYTARDARVVLTVNGGTPPYSYQWSTGSDLKDLRNVAPGIYQVTVIDSSEPFTIETTGSVTVEPLEFVCGRDSIIDVDGIRYPTVQIGGQCWTAANLRTRHLPHDPEVEIEGRYCNGAYCSNNYGAHYSWDAVMAGSEAAASGSEQIQGICPSGWHVPTRDEWNTMRDYLGIDGNGGPGTNVPVKLLGENSTSGFDALFANNWGYEVFTGENAVFWTAEENPNNTQRGYYKLLNQFPIVQEGNIDKRSGLSLRCVRDY